ncbi:DUF2000 family protein [Streptomyces sp. NPDC001635]|nr:DUF2000 family protein [Streptomyces sp. T1317-0309]
MSRDKKFVVVLNRSYELSRLTSAIGHVTAGLVGGLANDVESLSFVHYRSADGLVYPMISDWPFIVLKARGGQLATFREILEVRGVPHSVYLETMLSGGSEAQQLATNQKNAADIPVLAIAAFGECEQLDELTKRFSLWQ